MPKSHYAAWLALSHALGHRAWAAAVVRVPAPLRRVGKKLG